MEISTVPPLVILADCAAAWLLRAIASSVAVSSLCIVKVPSPLTDPRLAELRNTREFDVLPPLLDTGTTDDRRGLVV